MRVLELFHYLAADMASFSADPQVSLSNMNVRYKINSDSLLAC